MPKLSLRTIANACDLSFPLSVRQAIVNQPPNRLKEHLAVLQAECMPWEVIEQNSGHMAIHAALVETGEIVYFGGWYESDEFYRFDVRSESRSSEFEQNSDDDAPLTPDTDLFCSGHAFLADGRLLIVGGELPAPDWDDDRHRHGQHADHDHRHRPMSGGGERACWVYKPGLRTWTSVADMNLDPDGNVDSEGNPISGGRWYPGVATLFDNQVLAVGGHPDVREMYPSQEIQRHNNNTPERYSPRLNHWTLMTAETAETAINSIRDAYQRIFLMPNSEVFFATVVKGFNRFFNPYQGAFNFEIEPPSDRMYLQGSGSSAVLLPLLAGDGYRPRVLVCNAVQPLRIDLGDFFDDNADDSAQWEDAGNRDAIWHPSHQAPRRVHACSTLLPDGTVFVSGGTDTDSSDDEIRQAGAIRHGEIYDPAIHWEAGVYHEDSSGTWTQKSAASVERHYHAVALLMPNGTVWTAGSNGPDGDSANQELRIEIYRPPYCEQLGRPEITASPDRIIYGASFEVRTPQAANIQRVALIRNGSVTHAFNYDQRYIGLQFSHASGDRLIATAPAHSALAPPGYYMLWIIDDSGRPCKWASFLNVSAFSVRITAAACGVNVPISLLQDVFTISNTHRNSLRQQIHAMQRECLF